MTAVDALTDLIEAGASMAEELDAIAEDIATLGDASEAAYVVGLIRAWESAYAAAEAQLARGGTLQ